MDYMQRPFPMEAGSQLLEGPIRNRDIVPNLKAQRQQFTARIQKIDALLNLLERNPDFQKLFDLTRELI